MTTETNQAAGGGPLQRSVVRPVTEHAAATPLMRSMLSRAGHITPTRSSLVTEHVGGVCLQCEGRSTFRNTLDGRQPTVEFRWFIDCKRASKADVWRLTSKTHNDADKRRAESTSA